MQKVSSKPTLLTFEFAGLCFVGFLAFCNLTIFYDLFNYLQSLGIPVELQGLVIGSYSLTAMVLYLIASPFVNTANAHRAILLGMSVLAVCGASYLFVHSIWGLLALRILSGAGQFLMGAGTMSLLVAAIPLESSGRAFGFYSVSMLMAYGLVPALMDTLAPFIPSPAHGYAGATLSLIPAAYIVVKIRRRQRIRLGGVTSAAQTPSWADIRANVTQLPVALLILLNMIYFANWSSLFFLFKGFAHEQHIPNVGIFFSAQMGTMIIIRVLAGRLFDSVDKVRLVIGSFLTVAVGYFSLGHLPGTWAVPLVGLLFGAGMGAGYPAINGLMFQLSPARFRSLNANLMLFAVQAGFFIGPVIGGALVSQHHYDGYFQASIGLSITAAFACTQLSRRTGYRAA